MYRIAALLVLALVLVGCQTTPRPVTSSDTRAATAPKRAITVHVKGLTCPFCVLGIEKRLKAISAVQKVESNWSKGEIYVLLGDAASASDAELREAVKRAGFTAGDIDRPAEEDQEG